MTTPKTKPARPATAEAPRQKRAAKRASAPATSAGAEPSQIAAAEKPECTASKAEAPKGPAGKLGIVVALMRRPEGATVAQMMEATKWQAHSVRGAMAGSLKRKHKLTITSTAGEGGKVYRIAGVEA